jgi:hypothetical protein
MLNSISELKREDLIKSFTSKTTKKRISSHADYIQHVSVSLFDIPLPRATKTIIQITAKLKANSNLRDMKLRGGDQGALRCNTRALL